MLGRNLWRLTSLKSAAHWKRDAQTCGLLTLRVTCFRSRTRTFSWAPPHTLRACLEQLRRGRSWLVSARGVDFAWAFHGFAPSVAKNQLQSLSLACFAPRRSAPRLTTALFAFVRTLPPCGARRTCLLRLRMRFPFLMAIRFSLASLPWLARSTPRPTAFGEAGVLLVLRLLCFLILVTGVLCSFPLLFACLLFPLPSLVRLGGSTLRWRRTLGLVPFFCVLLLFLRVLLLLLGVCGFALRSTQTNGGKKTKSKETKKRKKVRRVCLVTPDANVS